jgi:hypothetical protein
MNAAVSLHPAIGKRGIIRALKTRSSAAAKKRMYGKTGVWCTQNLGRTERAAQKILLSDASISEVPHRVVERDSNLI